MTPPSTGPSAGGSLLGVVTLKEIASLAREQDTPVVFRTGTGTIVPLRVRSTGAGPVELEEDPEADPDVLEHCRETAEHLRPTRG